ncbi:MAG: DUF2293 domain-containing protein [Bacteroidales bacterium]
MQKPKIVTVGPNNTLLDEQGVQVTPPLGWSFLPAGDAGITRKVTGAGCCWRVQVKMGRRTISKGLWAPKEHIEQASLQMEAMRQTEGYQKKMESAKRRRDQMQAEYVDDFFSQIKHFLNFHPCYEAEANKMARLICTHATPVGSGTVARTTRIPIEERAAKAVIAWMRHQTTAYDDMEIARIKGERRRIRRLLAERSVKLLEAYRKGEPIPALCPLKKALS